MGTGLRRCGRGSVHQDFHLQPLCRGRGFVNHPKVPNAPLCKIEPPGGFHMTEYVVMHFLRLHREMPGYQAAQTNREYRAPEAIQIGRRLDREWNGSAIGSASVPTR